MCFDECGEKFHYYLQEMMARISLVTALFGLMLWQPCILLSKDMFRAFDLPCSGKFLRYHIEDLNNDGLKDLMLLQRRGVAGESTRSISIFTQRADGFAVTALQEFELDDSTVLFDVGDVTGDGTKEFVFITPGSVQFYSWTEAGFALSAIPLLRRESAFMLHDMNSTVTFDFVRDVNGQGPDEVFIPGIRQASIFYWMESQWQEHHLALRADVDYGVGFNGRFSAGARAIAAYATPYITWQDFNRDNQEDLVAIYRDSLVVLCQNADGIITDSLRFQTPLDYGEIWQGDKIHRTRIGDDSVRRYLMRVIDLNNDGLLDIVASRVSTEESIMNPTTELMIHFGRPVSLDSGRGLSFSAVPDQVVRPVGTQLVLDILDLNQDGRYDLLVPAVRVGLANLVRMLLTKSLVIENSGYIMDEKNTYPDKPDFKTKLRMKFSYSGGATSPVYEVADFTGDGRLDMMSSETNRLVLFPGQAGGAFSSTVARRQDIVLPQDGELVTALHINGDAKADLLIKYNDDARIRPEFRNLIRILLAN